MASFDNCDVPMVHENPFMVLAIGGAGGIVVFGTIYNKLVHNYFWNGGKYMEDEKLINFDGGNVYGNECALCWTLTLTGAFVFSHMWVWLTGK